MDEQRPARHDPARRTGGARLSLPPAVFLVHFAATYGFTGLACSFGWHAVRIGGLGLLPVGVVGLTALAVLVLLLALPPATRAPTGDARDPYDPVGREHFVSRSTRMTTWLAVAGMAMVALPSLLLARACAS